MSKQYQKLVARANDAGLMLVTKYRGNRAVSYILTPFDNLSRAGISGMGSHFDTQNAVSQAIANYRENLSDVERSYNALVSPTNINQ